MDLSEDAIAMLNNAPLYLSAVMVDKNIMKKSKTQKLKKIIQKPTKKWKKMVKIGGKVTKKAIKKLMRGIFLVVVLIGWITCIIIISFCILFILLPLSPFLIAFKLISSA